MNDKTPEPVGKGTARRRLIRGMFAAPAVLPLYSGAQVAVASNRRCIQNEANAGVVPPTLGSVPSSDTWIRVRLWTLSTVNGGSGNVVVDSTWVWGGDLTTLLNTQPSTSTSYLSDTQWQCVTDSNGSAYNPGDISSDPKSPPQYKDYTLAQNGGYVAVLINTDGDITGVVGVGTSGGGVHHSCWTSFKPSLNR